MAISHASSRVFPLLLLWITAGVDAVDKNNFKKCEDSSFCRNNRAIQPGDSPYLVVKDSIAFTESSFDVHLLNKKSNVLLNLKLQTLQKNTARFRITEVNPIRPRYEVKDVLIKEPVTISYQKLKQDDESLHIGFNNNSVILTYEPFRLDFLVDNEVAVSVNSRGLMNFEEYREKRKVPVHKESEDEGNPPGENEEEKSENEPKPEESEEKKVEEVMEEENWEETFKEHRDTRPRGPCSVGLDISFLGVEHVYGIPEHADSLALKTTVGLEPYRLYNLDVFEYELDSRMALYGSIPVMIAHSAARTVGVFWMNAAETWVDISSSNARKENEEVPQVETHWMSESGIIDVFVMLGPKPHHLFQEYASFTGTTGLPPIFGIAYHQSRWNYNDEDDVKNVDKGFDEHDIPYDVLWLDIEHTDGKKYMTWDKLKFPTPDQMQKNLATKGRKMVTIIDPHIKREGGYHIHEEASRLGYYVKNKDGGEYDNWCWPGSSSWIDFTNPEIRKWWASKFALSEYQGSTETLFTWNDMNEPSVFHGPEITMHKDALHHGNWEHRDVHNIYGFYQHMATNQGQIDRSGGRERPFVLSRAFFSGTQRHGPIWTGDNIANWDHLKASLPMVLTLNLVGLPFSGADVGGFFNNPDPELLVRWYQAAAFMPFFRAHAHLDTKRREPWLYEDHHKKNIRNAIRMRYTMLPYWYTLFYHASDTGTPLVRPLWVEYPEEKNTFAMEDEFLLGKDLLVKPVTTQGQNSIDVYLPGKDEYWYDLKEYKIYRGQNTIYVPTSMETIPLFQRGGSIIPTKQRVRRCSALMHKDPYTLTLALNSKAEAEGNIYVDDGHTFDYKNGAYVYMKFTFRGGRLIAKNVSKPIPPQPPSEESGILASMWNVLKEKPATHFKTDAWIERIVILGMSNSPKVIILTTEGGETRHLQFKHDSSTNSMTIKKPAVNIAQEWTISMHA